ncbi:hypothetical protein O181_030371 [Austropuccinia psidii MF-1]|uniref:Uncharacterized protein n=1 Tax=Austropuccinia psidii MF-1 TaxID=1389203 RepID=A0A9Q3CYC9_9BASI|nr:hypothetical protein [Austropuccinia psidii MF-1]
MNSCLTVRNVSGPSQCLKVTQWIKFIDGKEKRDALNSPMEENNPPPPKSSKNSPNSQQQQFQCGKAVTDSEKGQRQATSHKTIQPGIQNPKDLAGCHQKCVSDVQNHYGITEKGGVQIKISKITSEILDGIPNLYIDLNDVNSHISDEHSSICNNFKTKNPSLSQRNETLMCFEKR